MEKVPGGGQALRSSGSEQAVPAATRSLAPPCCRPESHMCFPVFHIGPRSHTLPFLLLRANSFWSSSLTPGSLSQHLPLLPSTGSPSSSHLPKDLRTGKRWERRDNGREGKCQRRME